MVSESVWMMCRLCLRVSEDASISNLLAKIYIRPWYSDLAFSYSVMYCIKDTYVWGVWMVSESVWMMSRLCLRVSEDASMPNLLAKIYIRPWYSDLAFSSSVMYCVKNTYVWGVWMVSESVWMMSRLCLRVSEDASMPNLLAKIYIRPWYSDLACSSSVMYCIKTPMRGVSGWCLRVSGWCLDCVWGCINAKSVGKNLY